MLGIDGFLASLKPKPKQECNDATQCLNYLKIVNLGVSDIAIEDAKQATDLF
jgi:hypothetical protein